MEQQEKSPHHTHHHLEFSFGAQTKRYSDVSNVPLLKNVRSSNTRWIILILGIITSYGPYFCFDNPQPLQYHIKEMFKIEDTGFNLLDSITLLPNIIFPFIGGLIMDSMGIRVAMIATGIITVLGQFIITIGAYVYSFKIMLVGRFIFGMGSVTLENSLLNIIAKWFLSRELTLSWGIARAMLRTSTALNSFLSPRLFIWTHKLYFPFFFGLIMTVFSLLAVFAVCYIDKKSDEQSNISITPSTSERIKLQDIKNLPKLFFLVTALGVLIYMSFHGFTNNVNNFLVTRYGFNTVSAGSMITVIYLTAAVFCPIVGYAVDKLGKRVQFLYAAVILIFFSNIYFLLLEDRAPGDENYGVIVGFVGFGLFYAFFSTILWTCFALIVTTPYLGTATGLATCLIAVSQTIFPEVLGILHDNTMDVHHGYYYTQIAHCIVIFVSLMIVSWILYEDLNTEKRLERVYLKVEEKEEAEQK